MVKFINEIMVDYPPPYRPSWADWLNRRVSRLPLPAWVSYLVLILALLGLALGALWLGDVPLTRTLRTYFFLSAFSPVYFLALIHYLDRSAAGALERFRPVLDLDAGDYTRLHYQLTTLPARPALAAFVLGMLYAAAALLWNLITGFNPNPGRFPPGVIGLDIGYRLLVSGMAALAVYHTVHQLRLVSRIYTRHTRINLFQQGPLYVLSNLAARTAIGISLPTYLWFWLNTSATSRFNLADILPTILFSTLILITFIWPLLGAHRLLEREKQRLLDETSRRIEAAINMLHQLVDHADLGEQNTAWKTTLEALLVEQGIILKLRTWPWRAETAGSVGAAFLLPIIIWLVQRLLERLGI